MSEKLKVEFKKLKKSDLIPFAHNVRVTKMNNIVEILSLLKEPTGLLKIKKLNKYQYMNTETGEVSNYICSENRGQNIAGLKKTFKKIRNLINNNFTGASNELFITLTYRLNDDGSFMKDTNKLYDDFKKFWMRFKYKYKDVDYISVAEPHESGAWHLHVLIRFNSEKNIFINNNNILAPMWGHGFTKIKSLKGIDNIGAYLSAYLSDVEVCQENYKVIVDALWANEYQSVELDDGSVHHGNKGNYVNLNIVEKEIVEDGNKVKKSFMKGARLHMYPSGMNLYRCSRGIKKPETIQMPYFEAKKIVGSRPANYSSTIDIEKDGHLVNAITYEQYNLSRKKSK